MSPCSWRIRQRLDRAALPLDHDRRSGGEPVLGHDRRIFAAGRRFEAIAEALLHHRRGLFVEIDVDAPPALDEQRAQVVDAVGMVGVLVGVENAVDPIDIGVEQLLAQIGRGVDEDRGSPSPSVSRKRGRIR